MHWGPELLAGGVNRLTIAATDPVSRQPELKHAAVAIERAALPHRLLAVGLVAPAAMAGARRRLVATFGAHAFASCVPFGRDAPGLALRLAADAPADPALPTAIAGAFGVDPAALLRYEDPRRGRVRWLGLDDGRLRFVLCAGDTSDEVFARRLQARVADGSPVRSVAVLMAGGDDVDPAPRPRTVCSCVGVTDRQIADFVARTGERRLDAVQAALSCGTGCGSCRIEVERTIAAATAAAAASAQAA